MKKLILALSFTLTLTSFFAQGYFEKKGKKIEPMDFGAELTSGPTKYNFNRFLADKRVVLYIDSLKTLMGQKVPLQIMILNNQLLTIRQLKVFTFI